MPLRLPLFGRDVRSLKLQIWPGVRWWQVRGTRLLDVAHVQVVPPLDLLQLPVRVRRRARYVAHVHPVLHKPR